jgi:thiamine transport system permease protein
MERIGHAQPRPLNLSAKAAFVALLAWFIALVLIPLGAVFARVGNSEGLASWMNPVVLAIARLTVEQAFLSTLFSALIGLPLGLWMAKLRSRVGFSLLAVPYGVPTIVAGAAWILWLGRSGILARLGWPLDWAYSLKAVILAHVFFNAPWIALLVAQARLTVSASQLEAARTLGAGRFESFLTVGWSAVRSAWIGGIAQAFSLCTMSFALVLVLGGGPPVQTLEVALYGSIRGGSLDLTAASGFAAWEVMITLAPWVIWMFFRKEGGALRRESRIFSSREFPQRWSLGGILGGSVAFFFILPYLALGTQGFVFKESIAPSLWLSIFIAVASASLSLGLAICALVAMHFMPRLKSAVEILLLAPSGISILVLGLGFFLAYRSWIDPFSGSLSAMILLQATLFAPVAFRVLAPRLAETRFTLLEAARTLGARAPRAFQDVEWPRWRAPMASAFALVAGASLGEVAAVSLFYSEKWVPLPLLISRFIGQYRFEEARSLAFLLFVLSGLLIFGISFWGNRIESA